jgi:hypothetical protein
MLLTRLVRPTFPLDWLRHQRTPNLKRLLSSSVQLGSSDTKYAMSTSSPSVTGIKMPSDASPKLRTAYTWLTSASAWDFPTLAKTLSDSNFKQQLHPLSLGRPAVSKQEWLTHMEKNAKPMFNEWSVSCEPPLTSLLDDPVPSSKY